MCLMNVTSNSKKMFEKSYCGKLYKLNLVSAENLHTKEKSLAGTGAGARVIDKHS